MTLIHKLADVGNCFIGERTKIWQFVVVLDGAKIGNTCNICAHCLIEGSVEIGNNVTIKSGVQVWSGTKVGDGVFIGPNVTLTNDPFPRSKEYPEKFTEIKIEDGASIGANATILPGVTIGKKAMIGAGSVVTKDVPPLSVVVGNPAKVIRFLE